MLSSEDKVLIKQLRIHKEHNARPLMTEFPDKVWTKRTLCRLIKHIDSTGSVERKKGSGRPRTTLRPENVEAVQELVMSQEGNPGTHKSVNAIARETGTSRSSVQRIVKRDLQLKLKRLVRAKQPLNNYPKSMVPFIFFTDEKLFTVAAPVNAQNDRV